MTDMLNMQRIPARKLNPAKYNPRLDLKPGDKEYEKLLRSVEEFGYVEPIIWNERTGNIVGGHQRLKVLEQLGYTEIDCVVINIDEQFAQYALKFAFRPIRRRDETPRRVDGLHNPVRSANFTADVAATRK